MANMVVKKSYGAPQKQILVADETAVTFGAQVGNTGIDADANGRKILKAGTPLYGNLLDRDTAFVKATTTDGTKAVWSVQITTAFDTDEVLTIEGVNYTCAAAEDVEGKKFAGANAAAQVTSLKKMVATDDYTVGGSSDTLTVTQKIVDTTYEGPTVSKTATTGAFTKTKTTSAVDGSTNANAVILHDVDVTAGDENGTIISTGHIDLLKLDDDVKAMIPSSVIASLKAEGIKFIRGSLV